MEWNKDSYPYKLSRKLCRDYLPKLSYLGYDTDDLMQECFIIFFKSKQHLSKKDCTDKHFINYFSKAVIKMLNNLVRKDYEEHNLHADYVEGPNDSFSEILSQIEFNITVSQMPDWMSEYIKLAMDGIPLSDLRNKYGNKAPTYGMRKEIKKYLHKK